MRLNRRELIASGAAGAVVGFATWWPQAQALETPRIRHSAHSMEGQRALESYRKAVAEMVRLSASDPRDPIGWTYQYKMHKYPDDWDILRADPPKLAAAQKEELDRIFGVGTPERQLAQRTLGTCHVGGRRDFWPWHRMYLFYFERICRKLSGDDTFALPYWGYSDAADRSIPVGFRNPAGKAANALWHERVPSLNAPNGTPQMPASRLNFDYLKINDFWSAHRQVESSPHGDVHILVGLAGSTAYDMRFVGRAPRDPVFWIHHCEIDRCWEHYLATTKLSNPADADWLENDGNPEAGYLFVDENRQHILMKNKDVLATASIKGAMGYVYDRMPGAPPPVISVMAAADRTILADLENLSVGAGRSDGRMNTRADVQASLSNSVLASGEPPKVFLTIGPIEVGASLPTSFGIYINLPPDADDSVREAHLVTTISTFGMAGHDDHSGHHGGGHEEPRLQYDATDVVANLAARGELTGELVLSTLPMADAGDAGEIVLREIRLEIVATGGALQ